MESKEIIEELHTIIDNIANRLSTVTYLEIQHSLDEIKEDLQKLEDYENLEKELGCPLDVLKPNQIVSFVKNNNIYDREIMGVNIQNKSVMIGNTWSFDEFPLNLYGRTWWLKKNKEE